jgi:para-aminobenzoate synthetase component 2
MAKGYRLNPILETAIAYACQNYAMARILVVDNYDSFVFNLVQYLGQLGAECTVKRNDEVAASEASDYDGVLISPGPGTPEAAGVSIEMIKYCAENTIPLFGVCLGHQAIGVAFGATVSRAPELLHGKTSQVIHEGKGVLVNLPSPFIATRYHSLAVERETVSSELEITGTTDSGVIMSLRHKTLPIEGVQFHPESVLTEHGHLMLANWLTQCGDKNALAKSVGLSPVVGGRS